MNALLGSLLVLGTFMTLCNAACFFIHREETNSDGCKDVGGVTHPIHTSWKTKNCHKCTCSQSGLSCCGTASIPVAFDIMKCMKILNKEECSYKVVERMNPEKTCEVRGWVQ